MAPVSANLEKMAFQAKDALENLVTNSRVGLSTDVATNPILFLTQPVFVAAYAALIAVSIFAVYMKNRAGHTAFWATGSIGYVVTIGFILGFYVPAFYHMGSNASDTKAVWHIVKPIIGAHVILSLGNWLVQQVQTCDKPGFCSKSTDLRKFIDTIAIPTRTMISAAAPFNSSDFFSETVEGSGTGLNVYANVPGHIMQTPNSGYEAGNNSNFVSSILTTVVKGSPVYMALVFCFTAFLAGLLRK
jgi:hypothetical protein